MKKRTFLKLSSTLVASAAIAPLESCQPASKTETNTTPSTGGHNWAGNIQYSTSTVFEPATPEELAQIIRDNDHLRVQGTHHSFNGIDDSKYAFVSMLKLNEVVGLNTSDMTVTVQGGIRYGELCKWLESRDYALHNLASLPHISVGGSIATATHGSGDKNGNLSSAVRGLRYVNSAGSQSDMPNDVLNNFIVHLGALGPIVEVDLKIEPTYKVRQWVYQYLPMSDLKAHFNEIFSSGYSVSLFTDWSKDTINQVWVKKKVTATDPGDAPATLFGAKAATKDLHPIESISAVNCTPQMGVPGPWHERLPHFKLDFTPSAGEELQAEYFVPRANGYEAIEAIYALRDKITPLIQISEVRSIAADNIIMSPMYQQDTIAIHFTWKKDWDGVRAVLPLIEQALDPYNVKPHWGKLFTMDPKVLKSRYTEFNVFKGYMRTFDPNGKFSNDFLDKYLFSA